jgi:O-antigen/teichoic acid export membrane protein
MSQHTGRLAQALFARSKTHSLERRLAGGVAGSFGLRLAVTAFAFFTHLLLARFLGAAEYGVYVYALAWVSFLGVLSLTGLERLLIREVAANQAESAWGAMRGLLSWSNRVVLTLSVIIGVFAAGTGWALTRNVYSAKLSVFLIALILLPLTALTRLRQSAIQGLHHVVAGQIPEALVQPALFIVLIIAVHQVLGRVLSARAAAGINVVATGSALLAGAMLLRRSLPQNFNLALPTYRTTAWMSSALPLLFANAMNVVNTQAPILLLGSIKGAQAAGLYAIASRGSDLIAFGLIAVNVALAPVAAKLWAERDVARLQHLVTRSVRVVFVCSLPVAAGLIIFGERFLAIFGREFTGAKSVLVVLVIGQMVNVAMGSVALLLVMTGHEREVAIGSAVCATLNVVLNLIMIPSLGIMGSALAVAISLIVWNILLAVQVYRRLGIRATTFGRV